ncbi:hypothetical protein H1Q63_08585 [Desmonostoc muscorum CCALA 125]|nr:hypothetical protein [Desmonostoc muscorum CCALA 125]
MGTGDWGLGIGDWGLGMGGKLFYNLPTLPHPPHPPHLPSPQSPVPDHLVKSINHTARWR